FLLTLAVVDDMIAITIIALFYSETVHWTFFGLSALLVAAYGMLQYKNVRSPWLYVPIALLAWYFLQRSGIHATVAAV
ncbi:Na+/H+ antiporter NhaA, partial [Micromonospora aurantiaca]|nr:Na+/H+ antiporter NhaA [Micromonospora aurantiaca]